jgi:hypothetical protein
MGVSCRTLKRRRATFLRQVADRFHRQLLRQRSQDSRFDGER